MSDKLPKVGSIWRARDGRMLRVEAINYALHGAKDWAELSVLNPGAGMRRKTSMAVENFGGFLQPISSAESQS